MKKNIVCLLFIICLFSLCFMYACTEQGNDGDGENKEIILPEFDGDKTDVSIKDAEKILDEMNTEEGISFEGITSELEKADDYKIFQTNDSSGKSVEAYLDKCVNAGFVQVESGSMNGVNFIAYQGGNNQALIVLERNKVYTVIYYKIKVEEIVYTWPTEKLASMGLSALTMPEGLKLTYVGINTLDIMGRVEGVEIGLSGNVDSFFQNALSVFKSAGYKEENRHSENNQTTVEFYFVKDGNLYYASVSEEVVRQDNKDIKEAAVSVYNETQLEILTDGKQIWDQIDTATVLVDVTEERKEINYDDKESEKGEFITINENYTETIIYNGTQAVIYGRNGETDASFYDFATDTEYYTVNNGHKKAVNNSEEKPKIIRNFLRNSMLAIPSGYYTRAKNVVSLNNTVNIEGGLVLTEKEGDVITDYGDPENGIPEKTVRMKFWVEENLGIALGYEAATDNGKTKVIIKSLQKTDSGMDKYFSLPSEYELIETVPSELLPSELGADAEIPSIEGADGYYILYEDNTVEIDGTLVSRETAVLYGVGVSDSELSAYESKLLDSGFVRYGNEFSLSFSPTQNLIMYVTRTELENLRETVRFEFSINEIEAPEYLYSDKSFKFSYNMYDLSGGEAEEYFAFKEGNLFMFAETQEDNMFNVMLFEKRGENEFAVIRDFTGETEETLTLRQIIERLDRYDYIINFSSDGKVKTGTEQICGVDADVYAGDGIKVYYSSEYSMVFKYIQGEQILYEVTAFTEISDSGKGLDGKTPMFSGEGLKIHYKYIYSGSDIGDYLNPCNMMQIYGVSGTDVADWKKQLDASGLTTVDYYEDIRQEGVITFLMTDKIDYCIYAWFGGNSLTVIEGIFPDGADSYFGDELENTETGINEYYGYFGDGLYSFIDASRFENEEGKTYADTYIISGNILYNENTQVYYVEENGTIKIYNGFAEFGTLKTVYTDVLTTDAMSAGEYLESFIGGLLKNKRDLSKFALTGKETVAGRECNVYEGEYVMRGTVYESKYWVDVETGLYMKVEQRMFNKEIGEYFIRENYFAQIDSTVTLEEIPDFNGYVAQGEILDGEEWKEEYIGYDFIVGASGYDRFSVYISGSYAEFTYFGEFTELDGEKIGIYELVGEQIYDKEGAVETTYHYYTDDGKEAYIYVTVRESYVDNETGEEVSEKNIRVGCSIG